MAVLIFQQMTVIIQSHSLATLRRSLAQECKHSCADDTRVSLNVSLNFQMWLIDWNEMEKWASWAKLVTLIRAINPSSHRKGQVCLGEGQAPRLTASSLSRDLPFPVIEEHKHAWPRQDDVDRVKKKLEHTWLPGSEPTSRLCEFWAKQLNSLCLSFYFWHVEIIAPTLHDCNRNRRCPTPWLWMNMPEATWGTVLKRALAERKQTQTLMELTPTRNLTSFVSNRPTSYRNSPIRTLAKCWVREISGQHPCGFSRECSLPTLWMKT